MRAEHRTQVIQQDMRTGQHIPAIPALDAAEVDTETTERQHAEHENPSPQPASSLSHRIMDDPQGDEAQRHTHDCEGREQRRVIPMRHRWMTAQMDQVGDDVGGVWQKQQPSRPRSQCAPMPATSLVNTASRDGEYQRQPGQKQIPDEITEIKLARGKDPRTPKHPAQQCSSEQRQSSSPSGLQCQPVGALLPICIDVSHDNTLLTMLIVTPPLSPAQRQEPRPACSRPHNSGSKPPLHRR